MKTSLELKRPIIFLKVQTTGVNPKKDRIVELCFSKVMPDGTEKEGMRLINPGIEIPEEATKINGITNEMVKDKPPFEQIAEGLNNFLKDSDFAGFGIRDFDLKFLIEEFNRAGIAFNLIGKNVVDLMIFYRKMLPRNFKEAINTYLNENIETNVISSSYNVKYSRELMEAMLNKHEGARS